jgi:hypothetical protein
MARKRGKNAKPKAPGKARGKPFELGNQAARGHGRPSLPADYRAAMEDLGPRGLQALSDIVADPEHPRHEHACEYVVNRWKGTPKQRTELSGPEGGPIPVKAVRTSDEKRRRVAELAERARKLAASRVVAAARAAKTPGEDDPGESD